MRVLVTGGAGFIGSNLVRALLAGGNAVCVVDDLSSGFAANLDPRAEFRKLDITQPECAEFIVSWAPEVVVHLAAQSSVPVSIADPERDRLVNAEGTRLVAAAARDAGARLVLSASSAAVYGEPAELPLREESAKAPMNPYGESKLAAESLLAGELDGSATDYASLRFANVYGPRQDAAGEGGVVALFMAAVQAGRSPVVFGDGSQTRDFIYVADIVSAILGAISAPGPLAATDGHAYNVSTGERTSVNELVGAVRNSARYFGEIAHACAREGDIAHSVLDPTRAQQAFGWHAAVELDKGVELTWRWWLSRAQTEAAEKDAQAGSQ